MKWVFSCALTLVSSAVLFLFYLFYLIIRQSLGSMETDHVINEPCYNEVIYIKTYSKIIN